MINEVTFGTNNFGNPKVLSSKDSIAQLFKNILFLVPGQLPSMPHVGINIRKYLTAHVEDEDLSTLKEDIAYQCADLIPYLDLSGMVITPLTYNNRSTIFIMIPVNVDDSGDSLLIGIHKNDDGKVIFNYKFDDALT